MQTSSIVSLAALVVAGTGVWVAFQQSHARGEEVASLRDDLASVKAAPPVASATRIQVLYAPGSTAAPGDSAPVENRPAPEPAGDPAPSVAAKPRIETAQLADHVEAEFRAQATDAAWSTGARQKLVDSLRPLAETGVRVRSVECRTSFCRVETTHATTGAYQGFAQHMMSPTESAWNGALFSTRVEQNDDGSSVTVTYLAREGYDLPRPEGS